MLGHDVPFSYCRTCGTAGQGLAEAPCRKVFDCWWKTFDVTAFIQAHFTDEQIRQITAPPPAKTATLIDLIQRAQQRDGS